MRIAAVGMVLILGVAACGGEPSDRVAVPGAPPGGDTRPAVSTGAASTTALASTTTDAVATSTTDAPSTTTTIAAPTTTAIIAPSTTVDPATTVPAPPVTTAPAATTTTTELVYTPEAADGPLRIGVEGPRSLLVQQQLIALAILPSTAADSKYGPGTAAGVRRFQESKGLVVDGVAGPNTVAELAAAVAALTPPTTGSA